MKVVGGIQGVDKYYEIQRWRTGMVLTPGLNPEGKNLPDGVESAIVLSDELPPIDAENWTAIQKLYIWAMEELGLTGKNPFHAGRTFGFSVGGRNNEAGVETYLADDLSHWIVVVARQVVGGASVDQDMTRGGINILTGEKYLHLPPPGYMGMGTSHSHNTMPLASFSGTDDSDELCRPGWHILCSTYRKGKEGWWDYVVTCSVVANGKRYLRKVNAETWEIEKIDMSDMIEVNEHGIIPWRNTITVHPDVFGYITIERPKDWKVFTGGPSKLAYRYGKITYGENTPVHRQKEGITSSIDWDHFFKSMKDDDDIPGQMTLWDEELQDLRSYSSDEEVVKRYVSLELESLLDNVARIEALLDSRMATAELLAHALNELGFWRKIKPRKQP